MGKLKPSLQRSERDLLWEIPKLWEGQTCYILGGGPSLNLVDIARLKGQRVIAVNNAYRMAPWADVLYFMDCAWYAWHKLELLDFTGLKVTTCEHAKEELGIKFLKRGQRQGIDSRNDHLVRGTNSGYGALSLAIKFGVKKIFLLGYDMRKVDGKDNFHGDHKREVQKGIYSKQFVPMFDTLVDHCATDEIEVFNATPDSDLKAFPIIGIEEAMPC